MGKSVGIDLGTTNSCIAVIQGSQPVVIPNGEGSPTTPSVVAFEKGGQVIVGERARRQAVINPERTIFGVKRLIGQRFAVRAVQDLAAVLPFRVVASPNGDAAVQVGERIYTPQEISAAVLENLKASAEAYLKERIDEAVITVPAYFNDSQRQATRDAGRIAGFDVLRIINEPTAAALAHGAGKKLARRRALVFDLGGGTFDVSALSCDGDVFEVMATAGDAMLGGIDFDNVLLADVLNELEKTTDIDVSRIPVALQRVREAVERARCELSACEQTEISLPYLTTSEQGPLHLARPLGRADLERLTAHLIARLERPTRDALSQASLRPDEIDEVILVGGMTRMPAVRDAAQRLLGRKPLRGIDPDVIVAMGAAWQAACLKGDVDEVLLLDVTPHSLGIAIRNGRFAELIPKNRSIPTEEHKLFATTEDNQDFVRLDIYQGNAKTVDENTLLGRMTLDELPRGPAGTVRVDVAFQIDANGMIRVTARHEGTGKEAKITVRANGGLSDMEVQRLTEQRQSGRTGDMQ